MKTWQVALVKEQGVEFAVVCVQDSVINSASERDEVVRWWSFQLHRPAVLMGAQRHEIYGRQDIAHFVSMVGPSRLRWRRMNVAA